MPRPRSLLPGVDAVLPPFSKHGSHNTHELTSEATKSGRPVGQWLDDTAAEPFIAGKLPESAQAPKTSQRPPGLGRQINPDGAFVAAARRRSCRAKRASRLRTLSGGDGDMDAGQEIHKLARTLNLTDARQDWGITISDPSRVEEFVRFCETSAGDGLVDAFERFLASGLQGLPSQVRYWSSLGDDGEFPNATLLRRWRPTPNLAPRRTPATGQSVARRLTAAGLPSSLPRAGWTS